MINGRSRGPMGTSLLYRLTWLAGNVVSRRFIAAANLGSLAHINFRGHGDSRLTRDIGASIRTVDRKIEVSIDGALSSAFPN